MTATTTLYHSPKNSKKKDLYIINGFSSKPRKLVKIDNSGKLYVPAFIRKLFEGYCFYPYVENGKLVFDPVKVEDCPLEEVNEHED